MYTVVPRGGGGQLSLKGGHHARTWTFKMTLNK